jgi:hypothetical protein
MLDPRRSTVRAPAAPGATGPCNQPETLPLSSVRGGLGEETVASGSCPGTFSPAYWCPTQPSALAGRGRSLILGHSRRVQGVYKGSTPDARGLHNLLKREHPLSILCTPLVHGVRMSLAGLRTMEMPGGEVLDSATIWQRQKKSLGPPLPSPPPKSLRLGAVSGCARQSLSSFL